MRSQYIKPRDTSQFISLGNNLNALRVEDSPKIKQNQQTNKDKDFRNIICYNYNKQGHYASKC